MTICITYECGRYEILWKPPISSPENILDCLFRKDCVFKMEVIE
jgi:hypothetical protein